ncbi:MAG: ankyrin repeat domain-containing protein [Rhodospirillales bacterium]|nr:ankyrin repeat domain-containing protein [Rhodospirillales bacterium]
MLAAAVGDVAAMRTLIAAGADPIRGTEEGTTPVMVAAGMGTDHPSRLSGQQKAAFLEAVKLAFAEGGDVNASTIGDRTALHGAVLYRLTDVVRFLAQNGADLEARDIYGQSAMSIALADPDGRVYRHLKDYNNNARSRRRRGGPTSQPSIYSSNWEPLPMKVRAAISRCSEVAGSKRFPLPSHL